ncbi:hypothetical protein [Paraburkholderia xenovorans]
MKNVGHPNMFPRAAEPEAAAADAVTDADVGGIERAPAPTNPWANPLSGLQKATIDTLPETKRLTRADEVIAYLKEHGPAGSAVICQALGISNKGGISPFIQGALHDGRIVRDGGKYCVGSQVAAKPKAEVNTAPVAVSHFEAASAIVAMRKKPAAKAAEAPPSPADPPKPSPELTREPDFTISIDDVSLVSWPNGGISIRTESGAVDLRPEHFRALIALVELRK